MPVRWLVVVSLAVSGCAARGPLYGEDETSQTAVAADRASIVVFRTRSTTQYSGAWAEVTVDGEVVGPVEWGGYATFTTTPGQHVVATRMHLSSVSCPVSAELEGGSRTFFEVSPRRADYWGHIPSMLLGAFVPFVAIPLGYLEEGLQARANSCAGAFAIEPVEQSIALAKLVRLRASKTAPIEAAAPLR